MLHSAPQCCNERICCTLRPAARPPAESMTGDILRHARVMQRHQTSADGSLKRLACLEDLANTMAVIGGPPQQYLLQLGSVMASDVLGNGIKGLHEALVGHTLG